MESLRRALALLESLSKVQRTPTFPGLGVPDDRRSTTIVTNPQQVRLRNRLMDHESKRIFGPDSIRPTTDSDRSGLASNVAPISYSKSNALRAQTDDWLRATSRHPYDELSTSLHEDMHQIFTRVRQRYGSTGARKLAYNLVMSMPRESREAAQAFAKWKNPKYEGNHEETLTNLLSYLNNPSERNMFRTKIFGFYGQKPWVQGERRRRLGAAPMYDTDGAWHPDQTRQYMPPGKVHSADQESKDLALAHDQAMKRGLRHLQTIAPRVNQEWTEWTAAHDPQMVARIKEAGGKVGKPEGIEAEGKQHQALSELWR